MKAMGVTDDDAAGNIARLFGAIRASRMLILLAVVAAGLAAYGVTTLMTPLYKGEASILIESHGGRAAVDPHSVASQVRVLQSTGLIHQVAKQFDLADRKEFGGSEPSLVRRLGAAVGLAAAKRMPADRRVLDRFRNRLSVHAASGSHIIVIQFSSQDPKLAADVANAMANTYVLHRSGLKLEANSDGDARLGAQIASLRKKASEAEAKGAADRSGTEPLTAGKNDTPVSRQLTDMASKLSKVRAEKIDAETRASSLRAALKQGRGVDTLANVVTSPLVQQLRQQEIASRAELAGLSTTLGSRHPRILTLKAQIGELRQRITAESRKVLRHLENESSTASRREHELSGQLEKLKAKAGRAGEQAGQIQAPRRDASAARSQFNAHPVRDGEVNSGSLHAAPAADAQIVSSAVLPARPYFPKTAPIIIGAMLAAFLLSCVAVMLRELFGGWARRPGGRPATDMDPGGADGHDLMPPPHDDASMTAVGIAPRAPRAGAIENDISAGRALEDLPSPGTRDAAPANDGDDTAPGGIVLDPADEDDFSIAAAAAQLIDDGSILVICVSPEGDEGSAACVILARLLAEQDLKTVLVDMTDSACPTCLMAGHDKLVGITDLLSGRIGFAEAIHGDRLSSAHIVPRGLSDPRSATHAAVRLPIILDGLRDAYDIALVECGPTDIATVGKLIPESTRYRLIVTAVEPGADAVSDALAQSYGVGYEDAIVMLAGTPASNEESGAVAA